MRPRKQDLPYLHCAPHRNSTFNRWEMASCTLLGMPRELDQSSSLQVDLEGGFREVSNEPSTYTIRCLTWKLYPRLAVFAKNKADEANPRYRSCLSSTCDSGQVHYGGRWNDPLVTCKACGFESCYNHGVPWHDGYTCEMYVSDLLAF